MMNLSSSFKALRIIASRELGDSRFKQVRNYELLDEFGKELAGVYLGEGCVYLDEDGLHSVYLKITSGIKSIYLDNQLYLPVPVGLEEFFYYKPYLLITYTTEEGKVLEIYRDRALIHRFENVEKGFISKTKIPVAGFEHGFCREKLFVVAKTARDQSFVFEVKDDKVIRESYVGEASILGWNKDWIVLGVRSGEYMNLIIKSIGSNSKVRVPISTLTRGVFRNLRIIYVNDKEKLIGVMGENEFRMINFENKAIVWSKLFPEKIGSQFFKLNTNRVAVYALNKLYVFDPYNGSTLLEYSVENPISSIHLGESILTIASGENVTILGFDGSGHREIGSYVIDGKALGLSSRGDEIVLIYLSLSGVLKASHISTREGVDIGCSEAILTRSSSSVLPLSIPTGRYNVKVIKRENKAIGVESIDDKFYVVDQGSEPGIYDLKLLVSLPGSLATIVNMKVKIEDVKSAIRKLKLQSLEVSPRGFYFPVSIETVIPLDEVYVLMYTRGLELFGSSLLIRNLSSGEHVIPIHIVWGKSGNYNATVVVNGWNKRNRLYEEIEARIRLDYDILPIYTRFFNDAIYVWSPMEVGDVKVLIVRGSTSYVMRGYIGVGWHELEEEATLPDELVFEFPSGVECIVRRGESWLRFKKR